MAVLNIHRPLRGSLVVGIPYLPKRWKGDTPYKSWLKSIPGVTRYTYLGRHPDCRYDCTARFEVGRKHLAAVVSAGVLKFDEVHLWTDYRATERCDTRCTNACGDECSCSCGGINHAVNCDGDGNPIPWMRQVGETTLVNSKVKRMLRVITMETLITELEFNLPFAVTGTAA